jgi:HEAT repeat protein
VPELIKAEFRRAKVRVTDDQIDEWLFDDRLVLLLDGVNEIPNDDLRRELAQFRDDNRTVPMIFTTRDLSLGGDLGIGKRFEMKPLSPEQLREFVGKYLPGHGERLLEQLRDRLREISETPLLLKMLCDVFDPETGQLPQNKGELFREFDRKYDQFKGLPAVSPDFRRFKSEVLQHLAFVMMTGDEGKPTELELTIDRRKGEKAIEDLVVGRVSDPGAKAKEWVEDLLEHHLLQVATDDRRVEFRHQLFQEYYAAEALLVMFESHHPDVMEKERFQQLYLNYLKWTETIAIVLSLMKDEEAAVRLVERALEVDLMLGARLAGEVRSDFQQGTINCIFKRNLQTSLTIQLLEHSRSLESLSFFYEILDNGCPDTRWRATRALSAMPISHVMDRLLKLLDDDDDSVRHKALEALGMFHTEQVISKVYQLTNDKYFLVRSVAIETLGKLSKSSSLAHDYLQEALINKDYTVRMYAAEYLGETTPDKLANLLQNRLNTEDEGSQRDVLQLLGRSRNIISLPVILVILSHQNWMLRSAAISEVTSLAIWLGSDAVDSAVPLLIKSMENDSEPSVRSTAAMSLKFIQSSFTMTKLLTALEREQHPIVKSSIIESLSFFSEKDLIAKSIISHLRDPESYVRLAIAQALRKLAVKNSLSAVRKLVTDVDSDVGSEAILCLGILGSSEEINLLYKLLKSKKFTTRLSSAYSLSYLKNRKGIPILKEAMENRNKEAREIALSALMNFADQISDVMISDRALSDEEYSIRRKAADFLSAFRDKNDFHGKIVDSIFCHNEDRQRNAMDLAKVLGTSKMLPHLKQITEKILVVERPIEGITAIQDKCKFYNYEIHQQSKLRKAESYNQIPPSSTPLEISDYENALKIISNMALTMERSPDTFKKLGEEEIRDHLLASLNAQYNGQATGETFNKKGKTDLLLRINNQNVLIVECKFWSGPKNFKEVLDQLLGYATWRDSQLAIVMFSRNKDFTQVLKQIPTSIREHPSFIRDEGSRSETYFRYCIRYPDDDDRELSLAIMAFNIPF